MGSCKKYRISVKYSHVIYGKKMEKFKFKSIFIDKCSQQAAHNVYVLSFWGKSLFRTNAYQQDIFSIWLWKFIISTNLSDISLMPAMWIFLDFWQRQFVPLALISIFICSENRKGKKFKSGASFKLEKCKYKQYKHRKFIR